MSLADYRLSGIAVGSAIPVHVAAETLASNCGNIGISKVDSVLGTKVVIDARGISHLVLLHEAVHHVILYQAICIQEVRACRRHELQGLHSRRIKHALRNDVSREWIEGGSNWLQLIADQIELLVNRTWSN